MTPQDLKKKLLSEGVEVYRTLSTHVVVAERVRENLILDSQVRIFHGELFALEVVYRVEAHVFRGETDEQIFGRVTTLSAFATTRGFHEVSRAIVPITDPQSPASILDHFYEITMRKDGATWNDALAGLRELLGSKRSVGDPST